MITSKKINHSEELDEMQNEIYIIEYTDTEIGEKESMEFGNFEEAKMVYETLVNEKTVKGLQFDAYNTTTKRLRKL